MEFVDEHLKILKKPIVTKSVQLINGKLDLIAVQLNTLNLTQLNDNDVKNLVWVEKGLFTKQDNNKTLRFKKFKLYSFKI